MNFCMLSQCGYTGQGMTALEAWQMYVGGSPEVRLHEVHAMYLQGGRSTASLGGRLCGWFGRWDRTGFME